MIVPVALAATALLAAGCGGSSSKPDYCSNVSDLQSSVDTLKSVNLGSDSLSNVQTDVNQVENDANAVVSSAKADFPDETSALDSSVTSLSNAIKQLPASPSPQQLLALAPQISGTVTAAQNLNDATSSACD